MRRLILFRHAKSDWSSADSADRHRTLSPRGRKVAGPMGAWLAGRGFRPDLVACSPAVRTRATWSLAKSAFTPQPPLKIEEALYESSVADIIKVVEQTPPEVQTLLIVGHNPGLENLVGMLATFGDPEARRVMTAKFPTAAIAVLDLPGDDWCGIEPGSARLDRFVTPKLLGLDEA